MVVVDLEERIGWVSLFEWHRRRMDLVGRMNK